MRIGILGGTFNPPHLGHLVCAQEAHLQLELDRVLFIPASIPPHKAVEDEPGANHRLALCRLAIEGIAVIMAVYLTISLSISLFMNWYNARIALVER